MCINITAGTFTQTDSLLSCGLIPSLSHVLSVSTDQTVIKNICFALSNIAAGSNEQIQKLIEGKAFLKLATIFDTSGKRVKIVILHVFNNAIFSCGSPEHYAYLLSIQVIEIVICGLYFDEVDAIKQSLEALLRSKEQYDMKFNKCEYL